MHIGQPAYRVGPAPAQRLCKISDQMACKPGSVRPLRDLAAIPLGRSLLKHLGATHPGCERRTAHMHPLLGLAPGGVYHASPVASAAVGSYPTLSPLPIGRSRRAVCFLWHFPSAHAGRLLAVALSTWSPDFPPAWGYPHTSGCPAIWSGGGYRGSEGGVQTGGPTMWRTQSCGGGFYAA